MIHAAKAPDGTYSYVAKMPDGEIVLGGDGCESLDEIQKFFADVATIATDSPCDPSMVHVEVIPSIEFAEKDPEKIVMAEPPTKSPKGKGKKK